MKKLISMSLALLILFGSVFSFVGTNIVYAQEEAWTEEDFLYSSPGNIIAYSDQGMAKQKKTKTLVFPEGTKSVRGNYSLDHMGDKDRFNREFGRGKVYDLVVFPDSVTSLGYASFYTGKIGKVKLSQNLKTMGGLAFFSCELSEVDLPDGLTFIGHNAFERNHLEEITIPKSVKEIDDYAFSGNRLHTIHVLGSPKISEKGVFHKQQASYSPKQNPFYEAHFGYNGKLGLVKLPEALTYKDGEFSFKNDQMEDVVVNFELADVNYSGTMVIKNPHKWSSDTQTDPINQDVEEMEETIASLEKEIQDLNKEKEENAKQIEELEEKLLNCKENGEKLQAEKEVLEKSLQEKEDSILKLEEEIQSLKTQDTEEQAEVIQLKDKVKKLQEENTKLQEDLSSAKWELEAEKEKSNQSKERIKDLEEKIEKLEAEIAQREEDLEVKNKKIGELEQSLAEKEEKMKGLEDELSDKEKEKQDTDQKLKELKTVLEDIKASSEKTSKKLQEEIDKLKEKEALQDEEIQKLKEDLNKQVDEVKKVLDRQKKIEEKEKQRQDKENFILEVDEIKAGDKEITGKTLAKYYVDAYKGNKRLGSTTSDPRGYFTIKLKEEAQADDKLKVIAEHPEDAKNCKEVEIAVKGDKKEVKAEEINSLVKHEDLLKKYKEFTVFQIGKNYYNIITKDKKTTVYMDVKAFIKDDRTMLPLRYVAYALGFNVEYNDDTREAIFSNKENPVLVKKTLYLNIDTGEMRDQDGNKYKSDAKPLIINGRIHASITNIAKTFGASQGDIGDGKDQTIEWDKDKQAVYVFKHVK